MTASFLTAYDALLARWGEPVDQFELDDEFGTTRVNACGPRDAPPLVLLAGYGAGGSPVWYGLAPRLAQYRRVYAIDLIGDAGRSTNTGRDLTSPADLYAWLTHVLDGLGLDRADFCGHSYGAWLALTYALHSPARVSKLALLDPTDCFTGLGPLYVARALPMLLRPTRARVTSFLRWETRGIQIDNQWLALTAAAAEAPAAGLVRPRRPTDLRHLEAELLVVVADRSRSHNPERLVARANALVPSATVVHLRTASHHSIPTAHTDELVVALERFLD